MTTAKTTATPAEKPATKPVVPAPDMEKLKTNPVEAHEPYPTGSPPQPTWAEINGLTPKKEG